METKRFLKAGKAICGVLIGMALAACHHNPAKQEKKDNLYDAQICFQDSLHDFGTFPTDSALQTYTFHFKNTGDSPAVLVDVSPSCRCVSADYTREVIRTGESGWVKVVFDGTQSTEGYFDKAVRIRINSPRIYTLRIKGKMSSPQKEKSEGYTPVK